jgi:uncharacterized membrane protein YhdT
MRKERNGLGQMHRGTYGAMIGALWGLPSAVFLLLILAIIQEALEYESEFWVIFPLVFLVRWVGFCAMIGFRKGVKGHGIPQWFTVAFFLLVIVDVLVITLPNLVFSRQRMKRDLTARNIRMIGQALNTYMVEHNHFPMYTGHWKNDLLSDLAGNHARADGWETPLYYGSTDGMGYTLKSYGRDRQAGGRGSEFDSDIVYINGMFQSPMVCDCGRVGGHYRDQRISAIFWSSDILFWK